MKINLSNDQKRTLIWIVSLVVCFALSVGLGIHYPLPIEQMPTSGEAQWAEGDTNFTNVVASGYVTAGGDITLGDDLTVGDTLDVNGDIDLDGDGFDVNITAGASIDTDGATNLSASAGDITIDAEAGSLVLIGSEAAADSITLDANDTVTSGLDIDVGSVSGLAIDGGLTDIGGGTGGTADGDDDLLVAGDAEVDDTLDVDGDIDLDGDGFDVNVSAGFSIDGGASSNVTLSAGDITVEAATGSVTIKGDEADAAAVFIDANEAVTSGLDIDVGSVSGLTIDGGLTDIGGGTYTTADGDDDLGVAGDLEVDGSTDLDNALSVGGDITLENDETLSNAADGTITATVAAGGYFAVTTGNLVVGDPALASLTLNGNDGYVQGNFEVDGTVRLDGELDVAVGPYMQSNGLWLPPTDDYTWNDSDVFTPTIHSYNIDTAGAVTVTLGTCAYDGQPLFLAFDDANEVIVAATNLRTTDGDVLTVNQYDTLAFVCMDEEWLLLLESNNQ